MNAIKTTGLTKYYGKERGIVDLNFILQEGEIYPLSQKRYSYLRQCFYTETFKVKASRGLVISN